MTGYISNGMGDLSPPNADPREATCQGCGDEFIVFDNDRLCQACQVDLELREQLKELLEDIIELGGDKIYKKALVVCQNDIELLGG